MASAKAPGHQHHKVRRVRLNLASLLRDHEQLRHHAERLHDLRGHPDRVEAERPARVC